MHSKEIDYVEILSSPAFIFTRKSDYLFHNEQDKASQCWSAETDVCENDLYMR